MGDEDIWGLARRMDWSSFESCVRFEEVLKRRFNLEVENELCGFFNFFKPEMFYVVETLETFILFNLEYDGKLIRVQWSKEVVRKKDLLHRKGVDIKLTQDKWVKLFQRRGRGVQLPSAKLYYATMKTLYDYREGPQAILIETIRERFKKDLNEFLMTGTSVIYNIEEPDTIIHNYGTKPTTSTANIIGHQHTIQNCCAETLQHILGTPNINEINQVLKWITRKWINSRRDNIWVWTLEQKPTDKPEERVVELGHSVDTGSKFYIGCDGNIAIVRFARWVCIR